MNKVEYLYALTEKALEQDGQVELVIDRLRAIEQIHKESPNIANTF